MSIDNSEAQRRTLLLSALGMAIAPTVLNAADPAPAAQPMTSPTKKVPPGKKGEFDFLAGNWKISHRQLKPGTKDDWITFSGEATCWSILDGIGSIEELRIPERNFSGTGIRLLNLKTNVWSDYWANSREAVISSPGTTGGFIDGVGIFEAEDMDEGKPLIVRGVWDRITPKSCRWYQGSSRDGGKTWIHDWYMDWVRTG
jgi:hypothetical protein